MHKVAILNNFLGTYGGGERMTFAVANSLSTLGCEVDVLTFEADPPSLAKVTTFFGPGHDGFSIRSLAGAESTDRAAVLHQVLRDYSIFINHCAGDSTINPCPLGLYFVMFPFQHRGSFADSYHYFLCNSHYTANYTRLLWGDNLNVEVIYPSPGPSPPAPPADVQRQRKIVAVGRFNINGHTKNQEILIDAFDRALDVLPDGWRLSLIGRVNDGRENVAFVEGLRRRCRRMPVDFELNVSEERKQLLLNESSLFWHAAGFGRREPDESYRMEHFGIAVVEAMASGAVPLCFARGGPREIVRHGESGFLYDTLDQLILYTTMLAADDGLLERMRANTMRRARDFDRDHLDLGLRQFMESVAA